jgi:thiol-disulfide isomerase/thioredoxin/Tfp pilus assembly protein PilF
MRTRIALVFLLVLAPAARGQVVWTDGTWSHARAAAKAAKKPIMLDFYATWCGPCHRLDATTYASKEVGDFAAGFINVRRDAEKGEGLKLAKQYKIANYPTIVFVDDKGHEMDRIIGYREPKEFLAEMQRIVARKGTVEDLLTQAPHHPDDAAFAYQLGAKLSERGDDRARAFLQRVIVLDPLNKTGVADDALMSLADLGRRENDYAAAAEAMESLLAKFPESERVEEVWTPLAKCYHKLDQDSRAAATLARAVERKPEDVGALNAFAWNCAEWKIALDKALPAAEKAVALSKDDPGILDTLAEVHWARGEFDEAIAIEQKAIEKSPDDTNLKEQLAKFQASAATARAGAEKPAAR